MKILLLIYFFSLTSISCVRNGTSLNERNIQIVVQDSLSIPENTVKVVDFDRVIMISENKLKLVNIGNPNELVTLHEIDVPDGVFFKSFLNDRYIIFENSQNIYYQTVIDILTGKKLVLKNDDYSTAVRSINPNDNSILYSNQIYHPELNGLLNKLYLTTFSGLTKLVSDSVGWASWSPKSNWILMSKFSYKEGYFWRRHTKMIDMFGQEIHLFDESVSTYSPIWTNDGSTAFFKLNHSGGIAIVEFNWSVKQPQVKHIASGENYYDPVFWSPCGQYFVHSIEHSDGHTLFGNDILLSDKNLSYTVPIITHEDIYELPIKWTSENGLITRKHGKVFRYEITH